MFGLFISRACISEVGRAIHEPTATTAVISEAALGVSANCAEPARTRTVAEIVVAFRGIYQYPSLDVNDWICSYRHCYHHHV